MLPTLLALAFVLPIPLFRPNQRERTDGREWQQLRLAFEALEIAVIGEHPRCREANLYGLYVRGSRQVVVCPRGDQSNTLRHEGWHAAQSLCIGDRAWLSAEQIQQRLSADDRIELQSLVAPDRWHREAEARAMAHLNTAVFLKELQRACTPTTP
jgi:hypothetical protein